MILKTDLGEMCARHTQRDAWLEMVQRAHGVPTRRERPTKAQAAARRKRNDEIARTVLGYAAGVSCLLVGFIAALVVL